MSENEQAPASPELVALVHEYERAKEARARWAVEEKRLKEAVFSALGYSDEDEKPSPVDVVGTDGDILFSVKVNRWRGMDFAYLKEKYPHIYAECETSKATKSIKLT